LLASTPEIPFDGAAGTVAVPTAVGVVAVVVVARPVDVVEVAPPVPALGEPCDVVPLPGSAR
jgi:hypothetical protein